SQMLQRLKNGLVLDGRADDVTTSLALAMGSQTEEGDVVALGRPRREDQLRWSGIKHSSKLLPCLLDSSLGLGPPVMGAAAGIAELPGHPVEDHLSDTRIDPGGRCGVQVCAHARRAPPVCRPTPCT